MRQTAPAKINLHLRVAPLGPDGFHPVLTWMCTVALFDTLTFTLNQSTPGLRFRCDDVTLPTDGRNLVVRATELLAPQRTDGLEIALEKRIPHGAGLGGGSSDAANTLVALNRLLKLGRSVDDLSTLAAKLGSDVPFFLRGPSSVCTGRGEIVKPIGVPSVARFAVLVLSKIHVPTPAVYRRFDEMKLGDPRAFKKQNEPDWRRWSQLGAEDLLPLLVNDLEPPAFSLEPRLARLHGQVQDLLTRPVRMSGSGSSLFTLFNDRADADKAATEVTQRLPDVRAIAVELAPKADHEGS